MRRAGVIRVFALAAAAGFSGLCMADPAAIERCRKETDSMLRLRCYDAIPLPAAATGAAVPGQATRPAPAQPAQAQPEPAQGAGAQAAAAPTDPTAQFGLESRPQAQQSQPEAIESVIPGRFDGWVRGSRFRLANGQVWEIRDNSQGTYALQDPKVRISRGVSGSFFMEVAGVSQTPRVRRVQ
jgi:hypothetical protein